MTTNDTEDPQSVELFAGGGGMALGLRAAGFHHHALVEWWAPAAKVLRHNAELHPDLWKPDRVFEDDVRKVADQLGDPGTVQLVAGGPPCQPFSLAGVHAGDNDERNMFPAAIDIVRRLRPELVVFENVPGLLRPSFAPYLDYIKAQLRRPDIAPLDDQELWDHHHQRIINSQAAETYRVYQTAMNAADYGVPQSRRRMFLIAIRGDVAGADTWTDLPRTHSRDVLLHQQYVTDTYWQRHELTPPALPARDRGAIERLKKTGVPENILPWVTLRDALADVPDPSENDDIQDWPNHRAIPGARTYAKHNGSPIDLPSKTIKAGVHGVAGGEAMLRALDGTVRYLTVREAALVQGFPNNYEFPGYRSRVMGVIGNAVAVSVAEAIGTALRKHTGVQGKPGPPESNVGSAVAPHTGSDPTETTPTLSPNGQHPMIIGTPPSDPRARFLLPTAHDRPPSSGNPTDPRIDSGRKPSATPGHSRPLPAWTPAGSTPGHIADIAPHLTWRPATVVFGKGIEHPAGARRNPVETEDVTMNEINCVRCGHSESWEDGNYFGEKTDHAHHVCGKPGSYEMCGLDCVHSFPGCALIPEHPAYEPSVSRGQPSQQ